MREQFGRGRVARLATIDSQGRPHLVPVCFALDGDTVVSIVDAKPKVTSALKRLANVRAHSAVSLLVDEYDDDWSRLWWVRADGTARIVESGAEHERAVARLQGKYPQYRDQPPTGAVMQIAVARWQGWSFANAQ